MGRQEEPCCPDQGELGEAGSSEPFLSRSGFGVSERASLARGLAEAYRQLGRLDQAEPYFETAIGLEPLSSLRAAMKRELDAVRAERERQAQNALRRPVVTENLEQTNLVRPHLRPEAPGAAGSKQGTSSKEGRGQ